MRRVAAAALAAALLTAIPAAAQQLPDAYSLRVTPQEMVTIQQGLAVAIQQGQVSAALLQKLSGQVRDQTDSWQRSHPSEIEPPPK